MANESVLESQAALWGRAGPAGRVICFCAAMR